MGDRYCRSSVPISTGHYHYDLKVVLDINLALAQLLYVPFQFAAVTFYKHTRELKSKVRVSKALSLKLTLCL